MLKDSTLDVSSLRIFMEAAKDCNMTRAASALGISQPAVSAAIKKIELALEAEVFDRNTRPIQLTTAGRLLWNRAYSILEQIDDLTGSIKHSIAGKSPDLRLGLSDCISCALGPHLLPQLMNLTENFSARTGSTPSVSRMLAHNNLDISISSDPMTDVDNTFGFPLLSEDFLVVVPKHLNRKGGNISTVKELANLVENLSYLRFGRETFDFVQSERIYRSFHFTQDRRIEPDTYLTMFGIIASGKGWAIVPPLGIWVGRQFFDKIDFFKLSIEATRSYFVLYNSPCFDSLAKKTHAICCDLFEKIVFPNFQAECPGLINFIRLQKNVLSR